MKLLALLLSLLLSAALLVDARPSLLQGRTFDDGNGVAVDSVPKRRAPTTDYVDKESMLRTNKLSSLSKYFSMHEW